MNLILQGDAATRLKELPDESVDLCVTSPPYYQLRDYGVEGQIGLESSVEEYIGRLVEVFEEVRRVLKKDGNLYINIGDSYAGSGKGAANYPENATRYKQGTNKGLLIIGAETGNRKGKVIPQKEWIDDLVRQADKKGSAVFMKESLRQLMCDDFRQDKLPWAIER